MRTRCYHFEAPDYGRYGGVGITVCDRWNPDKGGSFENFLADMGERPEGTTLDRFPNKTGNYEPSNCRWATFAEQQQNRSVTVLTPDKVITIRQRVSAGESQAEVSRSLRLDRRSISNVVTRHTWRNVA